MRKDWEGKGLTRETRDEKRLGGHWADKGNKGREKTGRGMG